MLFSGDDGLDMDEGYSGRGQFVLVMTGAQGDHAIEADSCSDGVDVDAQPRTAPQFQSLTLLGGGSTQTHGDGLILLRNGAAGSFGNLVTGYAHNASLRLQTCGTGAGASSDLQPSEPNATGYAIQLSGASVVAATSADSNASTQLAMDVSCLGSGGGDGLEVLASAMVVVAASAFANVSERDVAAFETMRGAFDPRPAASGRLCHPDAVGNQLSAQDAFFERVTCGGALALAGANWLAGWSMLDRRWDSTAAWSDAPSALPRPPPPPPPAPWGSPPDAAPPPSLPPPPQPPQAPEAADVPIQAMLVGVALTLMVLIPAVTLLTVTVAFPAWQRLRRRVFTMRCLSKPFYRWAFAQGRRFTDESIDAFCRKYAFKYLRKRRKVGVDRDSRLLSDTELQALVETALEALRQKKVAVADELERRHEAVNPTLRRAFARYTEGLYAAARTNVGLSHAKVREYWIYRGPRWLFVTTVFIGSVFVIEETIGEPSARARLAHLVTSVLAMTTASVMLYFRLPDSIRSGVCRSAHDFYVTAKKHELKTPKAAAAAPGAASASASSTDGADDATDADSGDDTLPVVSLKASIKARVTRKAESAPRWASAGLRLSASAPTKRVPTAPKSAAPHPEPEPDAGVNV